MALYALAASIALAERLSSFEVSWKLFCAYAVTPCGLARELALFVQISCTRLLSFASRSSDSRQASQPARPAMATSPVQEGGGAHLADRGWIDVQKKTFTNWVNEKLKDTPCKVEVLEKDFDDGITLVKLLEVLSKKKMHKK